MTSPTDLPNRCSHCNLCDLSDAQSIDNPQRLNTWVSQLVTPEVAFHKTCLQEPETGPAATEQQFQ